MKRKLFTGAFALLTILALAGCGGTDSPSEAGGDTGAAAPAVQSQAAAQTASGEAGAALTPPA